MATIRSLLRTLGDALRGLPVDLTSIPLRRAVLFLATPVILEMSMESLLAVVDIFYVSRLGADALATAGLSETLLSPVYALAIGLSAGATALVARRTGEKDPEGAATAAGQVILVALVCAVGIGIAGALLADDFLAALGASSRVLEYGGRYSATLLGGSFTIFLLFVFNALFRSVGVPSVCMRALWTANGLNILVAPVLIFGVGPIAGLGVLGGAIAATGSRTVGILYQLLVLCRGPVRVRLPFEGRHLVPRRSVLGKFVRLAGTATGQVLIETVSWLGLVRILALFGSLAVAGYTIAMRVTTFVLLPAMGVASSVATLVGQNLGANEPERARRSLSIIARYNTVFLVVVSAVLVLEPRLVLQLFTSDAGVIHYAVDCLRIVGSGFALFAYGMVTIQAFNGAGDPLTPMAINAGAFLLVRVPLAWALSTLADLGPRGVFLAITASYGTQALAGGIAFRQGRWQRKRV